MMKEKLPEFKDEGHEREFWSSHDSTEYIDWNSAEELILPNFLIPTNPATDSEVIRPPFMP